MRAVVIGAGHIARQHLACLKSIPGVELAGVCDLSAAMAESAAERFGVARWYTDYRRMLDEARAEVVHVTTPVSSHFRLAMDAMESGAHVFVEKPIAATLDELRAMQDCAKRCGRWLIEDHNYLFDRSVQRILGLIGAGEFGQVTHVEVEICLNILGEGSRLADPNARHPSLSMPGGAISDFLTHLSYLAYAFVGRHRAVRTIWLKREAASPLPSDEFRAMVDAEGGTASLLFSSHTQPDVFWLRVYGTRMRATANLFEPRLTLDRMRGGARPLIPLLNGIEEARAVRRGAWGGLWRKLSGGPGAYEGLWDLIRRTYEAIGSGREMPVGEKQIEAVNRLVADLILEENRL